MVIFLDIDGVLNQLQGNYYLDMYCVRNLIFLCKKLNANIVLTSSWRKGFSLFGKNTPQINNLTEMLNDCGIEIIGRTSDLGDRADEINEYINKNRVDRYIVLDDDLSEFNGKTMDNIFIVNSRKGLTDTDVKGIIKKVG